MHLLRKLSMLAALGAALSAPLSAQTVDTISSVEGTTGDLITITGSGFGDSKKPKVELVDLELDKKAKGTALKVVENSDTSLTVEIKKAKAGVFGVRVRPKGKGIDPADSGDNFTIRAPELLAVKGIGGTPNDEIELQAQFVGNKKPKIKVGGKKAKVTSVTMDESEGGPPTEVITIKIPKSLANGTWPVELFTKIGQDLEDSLVTVTGSNKPIGKVAFNATVNGSKLKAKGKGLAIESTGLGVVISANQFKAGNTKQLVLNFPFVEGVTELPVTFTGLPNDFALMMYSSGKVVGGIPDITIWNGPFSITLNAFSGGQLAGSFEGNLTSAGESPVEVLGDFIVKTN
ncbi:MAG: hypothetical protein DHS20C15_09050 [Planctomycetota bacterium]|nr:MAG: hypothetical protein DHS20C15_09050 [Planctomycetota bacterium]